VGPRTGLDRRGKLSPSPGFDPRTVQPVSSRYTDCATGPTDYTTLAINKLYAVPQKHIGLYLMSVHSTAVYV